MDDKGTNHGWDAYEAHSSFVATYAGSWGNSCIKWSQVEGWIKPQDKIYLHSCQTEQGHQVSIQKPIPSLERELHSNKCFRCIFAFTFFAHYHHCIRPVSINIRQWCLPYVIYFLPSTWQVTCTMCSRNFSSFLCHQCQCSHYEVG